MNIILIGMMGSAKSSVGRLLADFLSQPHLDLDNIIEEQNEQDIATIFAKYGEPYFRVLEAAAMLELAKFPLPAVISLGGGAILNSEAMRTLKQTGQVIYLKASPEHLFSRLKDSTEKRPLIDGAPDRLLRLREILAARRSLYEGFADFVLNSEGLTSAFLAAEILRWLDNLES